MQAPQETKKDFEPIKVEDSKGDSKRTQIQETETKEVKNDTFTIVGDVTTMLNDTHNSVTFTRTDNGYKIQCDERVEMTRSDKTLQIKKKPVTVTSRNNGVVSFSNGNQISVSYNNYGGRIMSAGTISGGICIGSGGITINGIDPFSAPICTEKEDETKLSKEWFVITSSPISDVLTTNVGNVTFGKNSLAKKCTVNTCGSGSIEIYDSEFDSIEASTRGSGGITIANSEISKLDAETRGSGGINLTKSTIEKLNATSRGSGGIQGFHATKSADICVRGSGGITGSVSHECRKSEETRGSGRIFVYKS